MKRSEFNQLIRETLLEYQLPHDENYSYIGEKEGEGIVVGQIEVTTDEQLQEFAKQFKQFVYFRFSEIPKVLRGLQNVKCPEDGKFSWDFAASTQAFVDEPNFRRIR